MGSDSGAPPNYRALLAALVSDGIEFVEIGGVGAVLLGGPIVSIDVDVVVEPSDENLDRMADALVALRRRSSALERS